MASTTAQTTASMLTRQARGSNESSAWLSGDVASPTLYTGDLSIAVLDNTPDQNRFLVMGHTGAFNGVFRYSVWEPALEPNVAFSAWQRAYYAAPEAPLVPATDKPWVVRRTASDFFLFWWNQSGYSYLRSATGDWWGSSAAPLPLFHVRESPTTPMIPGVFCCQPSIGPDGKVYLAYATSFFGAGTNGKIRVLRGTDPEGDNQGEIYFETLTDSTGNAAEYAPRHNQGDNLPVPVPAPESFGFESKTVPYLVCDPSYQVGVPATAGRHFVCFHDSAPNDSGDMNVYLLRLERLPLEDHWSVSCVQVNDESVAGVADQFTPVMGVDSRGWIHIVYYDNQPSPGNPGFGMKVDAWYALSTDHGQSFQRWNLRTNPDTQVALNIELRGNGLLPGWSVREYNGIALYESGNQTRVWTTYSGTTRPGPGEDTSHRSVIYGQQIVVTAP